MTKPKTVAKKPAPKKPAPAALPTKAWSVRVDKQAMEQVKAFQKATQSKTGFTPTVAQVVRMALSKLAS